MKKLTTFAMLAAAVLLLVTATFAQVPASNHVVWVMEENESASSVIGSGSAWHYLNSLATQYGLAVNYYANFHPSINNYFMISTGVNMDSIDNDLDSYNGPLPASVDNIVRHMMTAGKTWKSYAQSLPSVGYTGGDVAGSGSCNTCTGTYYIRHNPFAYFSDVVNSTNEKANLVPFTQFAIDLAANNLPNLTYIVPDGLHDAHDGTPAQADAFLQTNLAPLLASPAFQPGGDGLLIIAFDEAADSDTGCGNGKVNCGGGRIAVVLVGPNVKPGYQSTVLYQQQNLGRTIFEALGLSLPASPSLIPTAADMSDFFVASASSGTTPANGSPDFTLTATQDVTLSSSGSGSSSIGITPENGFNSAVSLSCSGLPAGATCSFSPTTVTPSGGMASVTMTINIPTAAASSSAPTHQTRPLLAFTLPFFALAAGSLAVGGRKKKLAFWVVLLLVLALGAVSIGCGGGSSKSSAATTATQSTPAAGASSYTVTVNASAGAIQHSTSLNVTVN
ncbi:MAG: alkaline phosphatase family protein [Candidatus Korobacteraceae bacterium]